MEVLLFPHNQKQIIPKPVRENKQNRHREGYHKDYYLKNKEKIKERARKWSKEHYIPHPRNWRSAFKKKQIIQFLKTFGFNKQVIYHRKTRDKGRNEPWKDLIEKVSVFQILKQGRNWILRLGIKNSVKHYRIGVFDVDGRGFTHIGTKNNSTYMRTPGGNHFFFLYEDKVVPKKIKMWLWKGANRTQVDFIVNNYVLGVGSWTNKGKYELKGRGYNFWVGIFKTNLEALEWFMRTYQATIEEKHKKSQKMYDRLIGEGKLEAKIIQPLNWHYYRHIWTKS